MRHMSNLAFTTGYSDNSGAIRLLSEDNIPTFIADIPPVQASDLYDRQDGNAESVSTITSGNILAQERERDSCVVVLDREFKRSSSFISLQKWEGVVTEVGNDSFMAKVYDLTEHGDEEIAEFPFEEISPDDMNLVRLGGIFAWNIGYYNHKSGQRFRTSIIRFRRLPAWSKSEIARIKENTSLLRDELNWQ